MAAAASSAGELDGPPPKPPSGDWLSALNSLMQQSGTAPPALATSSLTSGGGGTNVLRALRSAELKLLDIDLQIGDLLNDPKPPLRPLPLPPPPPPPPPAAAQFSESRSRGLSSPPPPQPRLLLPPRVTPVFDVRAMASPPPAQPTDSTFDTLTAATDSGNVKAIAAAVSALVSEAAARNVVSPVSPPPAPLPAPVTLTLPSRKPRSPPLQLPPPFSPPPQVLPLPIRSPAYSIPLPAASTPAPIAWVDTKHHPPSAANTTATTATTASAAPFSLDSGGGIDFSEYRKLSKTVVPPLPLPLQHPPSARAAENELQLPDSPPAANGPNDAQRDQFGDGDASGEEQAEDEPLAEPFDDLVISPFQSPRPPAVAAATTVAVAYTGSSHSARLSARSHSRSPPPRAAARPKPTAPAQQMAAPAIWQRHSSRAAANAATAREKRLAASQERGRQRPRWSGTSRGGRDFGTPPAVAASHARRSPSPPPHSDVSRRSLTRSQLAVSLPADVFLAGGDDRSPMAASALTAMNFADRRARSVRTFSRSPPPRPATAAPIITVSPPPAIVFTPPHTVSAAPAQPPPAQPPPPPQPQFTPSPASKRDALAKLFGLAPCSVCHHQIATATRMSSSPVSAVLSSTHVRASTYGGASPYALPAFSDATAVTTTALPCSHHVCLNCSLLSTARVCSICSSNSHALPPPSALLYSSSLGVSLSKHRSTHSES